MLRAIIDLNLSVQCHDLLLMCSLSSLQLTYVLVINASSGCEMCTLPVIKSIVGDQAVNTDDRSDQEGLTLLETFDSVDPCIIDVGRELLILDTNEPIDLVIDKILTLNLFDLLLVAFESVLQASSLNSFCGLPKTII